MSLPSPVDWSAKRTSSITRCRCPTIGPRSSVVNSGTMGSRTAPACCSVLAVCSGPGCNGCSCTSSSHTGRGSADDASRPSRLRSTGSASSSDSVSCYSSSNNSRYTSAATTSSAAPGTQFSTLTSSARTTTLLTPIPTSLASSSSYSSSLPFAAAMFNL